jgi:hypothetical protein
MGLEMYQDISGLEKLAAFEPLARPRCFPE